MRWNSSEADVTVPPWLPGGLPVLMEAESLQDDVSSLVVTELVSSSVLSLMYPAVPAKNIQNQFNAIL